MRLISIDHCEENMIVARPIWNEMGQVLLQEDIVLTQRMIERLKELKISFLYIQDERTADIRIVEPVSRQTKTYAMSMIKKHFSRVMKGGTIHHTLEDPHFAKELRAVTYELLSDISTMDGVMSVMLDVQASDEYTFQHSLNVTMYSLAVATKLGYSEKQLAEIGLGALLHDVGKLMIPLEILTKKGSLTEQEMLIMQAHTTEGFNMLRKIPEIPLLSAHCAFQHHERLDGSGYPRGIREEFIHPYAKLIAIADVFDALTTQRSYRKPILPHIAMSMIKEQAEDKLDGEMIKVFERTIAIYPIGISVRLSDGQTGVVVDLNGNYPDRPIVRVLQDPRGQHIVPFEIDLSKRQDLQIEEFGI